jgi:hypothetical protein
LPMELLHVEDLVLIVKTEKKLRKWKNGWKQRVQSVLTYGTKTWAMNAENVRLQTKHFHIIPDTLTPSLPTPVHTFHHLHVYNVKYKLYYRLLGIQIGMSICSVRVWLYFSNKKILIKL